MVETKKTNEQADSPEIDSSNTLEEARSAPISEAAHLLQVHLRDYKDPEQFRAMHDLYCMAAVPNTLTADLLSAIRVNFSDLPITAEAELLKSSIYFSATGEPVTYYLHDPVRHELLGRLVSTEEGRERLRGVAELVCSYVAETNEFNRLSRRGHTNCLESLAVIDPAAAKAWLSAAEGRVDPDWYKAVKPHLEDFISSFCDQAPREAGKGRVVTFSYPASNWPEISIPVEREFKGPELHSSREEMAAAARAVATEKVVLFVDKWYPMEPFRRTISSLIDALGEVKGAENVSVYGFERTPATCATQEELCNWPVPWQRPENLAEVTPISEADMKRETVSVQGQSERIALQEAVVAVSADSSVIFISHVGAADLGSFGTDTALDALHFWKTIKAKTPHAVILNPLPRSEWTTVVDTVAQHCRMEPLNAEGLKAMADDLKGDG